MTGDTFRQLGNKYTLQRLIGEGGMAEVYKAKLSGAEGFEKLVVIKRLFPQFAKDPEIVGHFIAEAKLAALLQHENIAQVYDFGELDDSYFIAMEYLAGRDLHSVIRRSKEVNLPLGLAQAMFITARVCEGMEYAHDLKDHRQQPLHLIHRDLSPHNVFITWEGRVKIIDFGIARADLFDNKTKVGMAKGKISYMSPEQLGAEQVDHRSDIFAIGILLYEMLSGRRMYSGDTATLIRKCMAVEYEQLESVRPGLPQEVYAILDRALAKEVTRRYQRCADMLAEIEEALFNIERRPSAHLLGTVMRQLFAGQTEERPMPSGDADQTTALLPTAESSSPPAPEGGEKAGAGKQIKKGTQTVDLAAIKTSHSAAVLSSLRFGGMKIWSAVGMVVAASVLILAWQQPSKKPEAPLPASAPVAAETAQPGVAAAVDPRQTRDVHSTELVERSKTTEKNAKGMFSAPKDDRFLSLQGVVGEQRQKTVKELLARAEKAMAGDRMTAPKGNNAYQFYREVLALESRNVAALQGLAAIAERYADMADAAFREMRLPSANNFCRQGLAIDPQNPRLLELQQDLGKSKPEMFLKSIERSLNAPPVAGDNREMPGGNESAK